MSSHDVFRLRALKPDPKPNPHAPKPNPHDAKPKLHDRCLWREAYLHRDDASTSMPRWELWFDDNFFFGGLDSLLS